jgi:hypothetical protein
MATSKKGGGSEKPLQADRIMERLVGDSTQVTTGLTSYIGLLGRSPKDGYWLLYLTLDMSTSVEIREEDIVHSEQLPPDQSPFGSLGGTQVFVRKDAQVTTTRTISRTHEAGAGGDEFDLDIRLGGGANVLPQPCIGTQFNTTCGADCGGGTGDDQSCFTCASCGDTCFRTCRDTCKTQCDTCPGDTCNQTCNTCKTQCGQPTCKTQCGTCNTCQTQCGTCQTCQTQCATCQTCQTKCGQATCNTCKTKCGQVTCPKTECGTCPGDTCQACTHVTCFNTCDFC